MAEGRANGLTRSVFSTKEIESLHHSSRLTSPSHLLKFQAHQGRANPKISRYRPHRLASIAQSAQRSKIDVCYRSSEAATGQPELLRPGRTCIVASARAGYANRLNTGN